MWDRAPKLAARLAERAAEFVSIDAAVSETVIAAPEEFVAVAKRPGETLEAVAGARTPETIFSARLEFFAQVERVVRMFEEVRGRLLDPGLISDARSSGRNREVLAMADSLANEENLRRGVEGALRHLLSAQGAGSCPPKPALAAFIRVGNAWGYGEMSARLLDSALGPGLAADTARAQAARAAIGADVVADEWRTLGDAHPIAKLGTLRGIVARGAGDAPAPSPHQEIDLRVSGPPPLMYEPTKILRGNGATLEAGLTTSLVRAYETVRRGVGPGPVTGGAGRPAVSVRLVVREDDGPGRVAGYALDPPPTPAHVVAGGRHVWRSAVETPELWGAAGSDGPRGGAPRAPFRTRFASSETLEQGTIASDSVLREAKRILQTRLEGVDETDRVRRGQIEETAAADSLAGAFFAAAARSVDAASRYPSPYPGRAQELAMSSVAQFESARATLESRLRRADPNRDFEYRLRLALGAPTASRSRQVVKREAFRPEVSAKMAHLLGSV